MQLKIPWRRGLYVPPGPATLDRNHRLVNGLCFLAVPAVNPASDLVTGLGGVVRSGASPSRQGTVVGQAVFFSNSGSGTDGVSWPGFIPIKGTADFAIAVIANPTAHAQLNFLFCQYNTTGGNSTEVYLCANQNAAGSTVSGAFNFLTDDNTSFTDAGASGVVDGNFHVFMGTRLGTTLTLYVDGRQVAQVSGTLRNFSGSNQIQYGNLVSAGANCGVATAAAWNRALSPIEVLEWSKDPTCLLSYPDDDIFASFSSLGAPAPGTVSPPFPRRRSHYEFNEDDGYRRLARNRLRSPTPVSPPPGIGLALDALTREMLESAGSSALAALDLITREVLDSGGSSALTALDMVVREVLVSHGGLPEGGLAFDAVIREVTVSSPQASGPIPVFPLLPNGFPIKLRPTMKTTVGTVKSGREMRYPQQTNAALWEIELLFEELRDQTQNAVPFSPMAGFLQYEQLVQIWLMMYGQSNLFAFDAPWDNSRSNQLIGVGDGQSYIFTVFRTWGITPVELTEPVGMINQVIQVKVGGVTVSPSNYYTARNKIYFIDKFGAIHPPGNGDNIVMTFSFYYLCQFLEDTQDFTEFSEGRWTVPSLKFRSTYWP